MQYMLTAIKVDGFKFKFPFANNIHFNYSFTSLRCAIGATFKHHLFVGMGSRWIFFSRKWQMVSSGRKGRGPNWPRSVAERPRRVEFLGRGCEPLPSSWGIWASAKLPSVVWGEFLTPIDDLWRLRFLSLISCVYGKIWGQLALASQSQIWEKLKTYKRWPS